MTARNDSAKSRDASEWGYQEHNGPACWASLDVGFAQCGNGSEQSPIDLVGWEEEPLPPVAFNYGSASVSVENTGHSIEVKPSPGHGIVVEGSQFRLMQFHFHHRSEHLIRGEQFPMELHLVHASEEGGIAVVGVMILEGKENDTLAPVWEIMPEAPDGPHDLDVELDLRGMLPQSGGFYRYRGSLTTPPCTEGVRWLVAAEFMEMSAVQIAGFARLFPGNFRPVQPIGIRTLLLG